jgi:hypothetical protein
MKDKILNYLAAGLRPSQVASLVGCSPGYISQLAGEEEFKEQLRAKMLDSIEPVEETMDKRYQGLESDLINAMRDTIPNSELPAITRALEVVSRIRSDTYQRKNPLPQQGTTNVHIVQLTLPAHAIPAAPVIQMSSNGEILAINEQLLAPLSSDGVKDLFTRIKERRIAASTASGVIDAAMIEKNMEL